MSFLNDLHTIYLPLIISGVVSKLLDRISIDHFLGVIIVINLEVGISKCSEKVMLDVSKRYMYYKHALV